MSDRKEGLFKSDIIAAVYGYVRDAIPSSHRRVPTVLMQLIILFLSNLAHRVMVNLRTRRIKNMALLWSEDLSSHQIMPLLDVEVYVLCFIWFLILVWYVFVLYVVIKGCFIPCIHRYYWSYMVRIM